MGQPRPALEPDLPWRGDIVPAGREGGPCSRRTACPGRRADRDADQVDARHPLRARRDPRRRPLRDPARARVPVRVRLRVRAADGGLHRRGALRRSRSRRPPRRPGRAREVRALGRREPGRSRWSSPSSGPPATAHRLGTPPLPSGCATDGSVALYGAARDITAQWEAERELAAARSATGCWRRTPPTSCGAPIRTRSSSGSRRRWRRSSAGRRPRWSEPASPTSSTPTTSSASARAARPTTATACPSRPATGARTAATAGSRSPPVPCSMRRARSSARVGSCRDVHSEVEAYHALERSEQRFRLAMESAPTGMAVLDLDGASSRSTPSSAGCSGTTRSGCSRTPSRCRPPVRRRHRAAPARRGPVRARASPRPARSGSCAATTPWSGCSWPSACCATRTASRCPSSRSSST